MGYPDNVDSRKEMDAAIFERVGDVAVVTLSRPQNANSLNTQMHIDVVWAWEEINANPDIRAAIVTGNGKFFCAGRDVKEYLEFYGKDGEKKIRPIDDPNSPMFGKLCNHFHVTKPLIAAINGVCVGGGLEIALMCDLRVMAEDTYIADLHAKVNVGGMNSLASEFPWPIANYLTMANGRLSAQECLHFGFVNRTGPKEKLMEQAFELAEMVKTSGPDSIRHLKQGSIRRQIQSGNLAEPGQLEARRGRMEAIRASQEADKDLLEGMRAFAEKRGTDYDKTS
ncbi:MAG: enoyl-CoA hydratase/isomerase family protein [Dehalococcoidia bacterium]